MTFVSFLFLFQSFVSIHTLAVEPSQKALLLDLELIVRAQESTGWLLDEIHFVQMKPRILEMTCQLQLEPLKLLDQKLKVEIKRVGSVNQRWSTLKTKGDSVDLDQFSTDLRFERIQRALAIGITHRKQCPFWLSPKPLFRGLHRDANRWQLIIESMGGGKVAFQNNDWLVGGSAHGRFLVSHGFNLNQGIALGLEGGVDSLFPRDDQGQRGVEATWLLGIPFLYRGWSDNLRLDTEITALVRLKDQSIDEISNNPLYGFRISQGVGFSALRILGFLPHFMLWVGYESYWDEGTQYLHVIRLGTRVGINWSL